MLIYIFLLFLILLFYFPFYCFFIPHVCEIILGGWCLSSSVESFFKFLSLCYCLVAKSCLTLCNPMDCTARLLCLWDFQGKNTREGCHFLLQGNFLTQGSNPCLLHSIYCRQILYWWATREAIFIIINIFKEPNFLLNPVVSIF